MIMEFAPCFFACDGCYNRPPDAGDGWCEVVTPPWCGCCSCSGVAGAIFFPWSFVRQIGGRTNDPCGEDDGDPPDCENWVSWAACACCPSGIPSALSFYYLMSRSPRCWKSSRAKKRPLRRIQQRRLATLIPSHAKGPTARRSWNMFSVQSLTVSLLMRWRTGAKRRPLRRIQQRGLWLKPSPGAKANYLSFDWLASCHTKRKIIGVCSSRLCYACLIQCGVHTYCWSL